MEIVNLVWQQVDPWCDEYRVLMFSRTFQIYYIN